MKHYWYLYYHHQQQPHQIVSLTQDLSMEHVKRTGLCTVLKKNRDAHSVVFSQVKTNDVTLRQIIKKIFSE